MLRQITLLSSVVLVATAARAAAAPQVLNPSNGHAYLVVDDPGISWGDARAQAQQSTFQGVTGHLATVTTQAESDFIANLTVATVWLGGFQNPFAADFAEPGGGWSWVTGEPFTFTRWQSGEPNNSPAPEDFLECYSSGSWNDSQPTGFAGRFGYVIEYDLALCLPDDALAPNHSCATAHVFPGPAAATNVIDEPLRVSNGAPDFFFVGMDPSGSTTHVRLEFDHQLGDVDLFVYSAFGCGGTPSASSTSAADFEAVTVTTTDDLIVEVRRSGGPGSCSDYKLNILQERVDGGLGGTICANGTNSIFVQADLFVSGSTAAADNDLRLRVNSLPANSFGFFLNGRGAGFATPANSQGFLCINNGGVGRFNRPGEILSSGPSPFGSVLLDVDLTDIPRPSSVVSIQPGERWAFQYWYRDVTGSGAPTSNFSSAQMVWFD